MHQHLRIAFVVASTVGLGYLLVTPLQALVQSLEQRCMAAHDAVAMQRLHAEIKRPSARNVQPLSEQLAMRRLDVD